MAESGKSQNAIHVGSFNLIAPNSIRFGSFRSNRRNRFQTQHLVMVQLRYTAAPQHADKNLFLPHNCSHSLQHSPLFQIANKQTNNGASRFSSCFYSTDIAQRCFLLVKLMLLLRGHKIWRKNIFFIGV